MVILFRRCCIFSAYCCNLLWPNKLGLSVSPREEQSYTLFRARVLILEFVGVLEY